MAALVTSLSFNTSAQAPPPVIVIKFSHVVSMDAPKGQAAERFKVMAQKLTKGRVRVEVYPMSTLVKGDDGLAALQAGTVQMLAPSLATFGPTAAEDAAFRKALLPVQQQMEGRVGKGLIDSINKMAK